MRLWAWGAPPHSRGDACALVGLPGIGNLELESPRGRVEATVWPHPESLIQKAQEPAFSADGSGDLGPHCESQSRVHANARVRTELGGHVAYSKKSPRLTLVKTRSLPLDSHHSLDRCHQSDLHLQLLA